MHVLIIQDEHDLRLYWKKAQGSRTIHFNYTPFSVKESRVLDCQFGPHYFKQKPTKGNDCGYRTQGKLDVKHTSMLKGLFYTQSLLFLRGKGRP